MSSTEQSETRNEPADTPPTPAPSTFEFLFSHKREVGMWFFRTVTMMCTFLYLFPIATGNPYGYYYNALMANGVTSILRLNQRLPKLEFTRVFLAHLLQEDSCHYIFYTLIFLYANPTNLVLLPVFLFAFLHSTSFTIKLLEVFGFPNCWLSGKLETLVRNQSKGILRLIAFTEIFLLPLSILSLFFGKGSILTPVVYYRFLTLRYQSKRNPYTRGVFCELRLSIEILASMPAVPERLRRLCHKLIEFVSRLAPTMENP